jgi:DNA-binding NarL/FixJ family response regulator
MRKFPIILLVDDSKAFRLFCSGIIKKSVKWARIKEAEDGLEGLQLYLQFKPDVILLDLNMPKLHGKQVLSAIMKSDPTAKVIVTSAYDDNQGQAIVNELIKLGATSFVPKPMNRTILMKAIKDVLHQNNLSVTRKKSTKNNMERTVVLNTNYD